MADTEQRKILSLDNAADAKKLRGIDRLIQLVGIPATLGICAWLLVTQLEQNVNIVQMRTMVEQGFLPRITAMETNQFRFSERLNFIEANRFTSEDAEGLESRTNRQIDFLNQRIERIEERYND